MKTWLFLTIYRLSDVSLYFPSLYFPVTRLPEKGPATGSIIGGIIAVILILAIIGTGIAMWRKHKNKKLSGEWVSVGWTERGFTSLHTTWFSFCVCFCFVCTCFFTWRRTACLTFVCVCGTINTAAVYVCVLVVHPSTSRRLLRSPKALLPRWVTISKHQENIVPSVDKIQSWQNWSDLDAFVYLQRVNQSFIPLDENRGVPNEYYSTQSAEPITVRTLPEH